MIRDSRRERVVLQSITDPRAIVITHNPSGGIGLTLPTSMNILRTGKK
jgi:hypothetical protein